MSNLQSKTFSLVLFLNVISWRNHELLGQLTGKLNPLRIICLTQTKCFNKPIQVALDKSFLLGAIA